MILNDYFCNNRECEKHNLDIEYFLKRDDPVPVCDTCHTTMSKRPTAPKSSHVSWSTWRI